MSRENGNYQNRAEGLKNVNLDLEIWTNRVLKVDKMIIALSRYIVFFSQINGSVYKLSTCQLYKLLNLKKNHHTRKTYVDMNHKPHF